MDEITEKFNSTLGDEKQNFEELYKNWGRLGNQEDRRQQLLDVQKEDRNKKIDNVRGILEIVNEVENRNNKVRYRPNIYVAGFSKASQTYRDVLMQSEWLIEKPADFHENWYVVPCPKGTRVLLVANRGTTKCYTKYGSFMWECRSALPGGNLLDKKQSVQCCVLDCFWQEKNNTMYVLDVLAWKNQNMTDGEMEFRHFWLTTQLADFASLRILSKYNDVIFSMLPKIPCDVDNFNTFMAKYPAFEGGFPLLDGLLFYHKKAHYVSGETPLVGWLFSFMVKEVLGSDITVHENYMLSTPADYVNQADFIVKFEAKYAKKNKFLHSSNSSSKNISNKQESDNVESMEAEETKTVEKMKNKSRRSIENRKTSSEKKTHKQNSQEAGKVESMEAEEIKTVEQTKNKVTGATDHVNASLENISNKQDTDEARKIESMEAEESKTVVSMDDGIDHKENDLGEESKNIEKSQNIDNVFKDNEKR